MMIKRLFLCLGAAVWIVLGAASSVHAAAGETAAYDGFLVGMAQAQGAQLFSDGENCPEEWITDTVYWVPSWEGVEELLAQGTVTYVEPNYIATLFTEDSTGTAVSNGWPYAAVSAGTAAGYGLNGQGVRIALIDSGVDLTNPDLQNALIGEGHDYILNTAEMCDTVYHGTKIAQLMAGDENAIGLTGIASGAEIIPLRCFSDTAGGTVGMLAQAIRDAVNVYHCDVINMSWGLAVDSETLRNAVQYAYDAGVVLVGSAGNVSSRYPQGTVIYPAAYETVISVSAVDAALEPSSRSQANAYVTACAPGVDIPFILADGSVKKESGTSFSAPCVTAGIAVLMQLAPSMDGEAALDVLKERAVDLGEEGRDPVHGYGLFRLDALLGQTWSWMRDGGQEEAPWVFGWLANSGDGHTVLSSYSGEGQMLDVRMHSGSGLLPFEVALQADGVSAVQICQMDKDFVPLAASGRYLLAAQ